MANNDDAENARIYLEQSIQKYISKKRRNSQLDESLEEECTHCVHHANHVLRTLVAKRTSLEYALKALEEESPFYVEEFARLNASQKDHQRQILTQWFSHFLRLRDAFQLMESGERRHINDNESLGAHSKFQSRLSGAFREDGVTRKYKSELGYTGFGWDEFYDEDVGIRKRLLHALTKLTGKKHIAETVIGNWEQRMDQHQTATKLLSEQLNSIHRNFVNNMNQILVARGVIKLTLVTDDKFERMTWGLVDIRRTGNKFAIMDVGGSVPIGMTLEDWRRKVSLKEAKSAQSDTNTKKRGCNQKIKNRLVIHDSSDEDEIKNKSVEKHIMKKPSSKTKNEHSDNNGLKVRLRIPTDISNIEKDENCGQSTSVEEIKRQLGVSTKQLEEGLNQLEDEKRASTIAANNDELHEILGEVFGTMSQLNEDDENNSASRIPLLEQCMHQWKKIQQHRHLPLEFSMEEVQEDFKENLSQWRKDGECFALICLDIAKGKVKNDSDEAYIARENYREANMLLGILFLKIHEFLSNHLQVLHDENPHTSIALKCDLSETDYTFLNAARESFEMALKLILKQESSQADLNSSNANSFKSVEKLWEKGQHLLLRGRAQTNIGLSLYELSQCDFAIKKHREQRHLLSKASSLFKDALDSMRKLRHNTVVIQNHPRCYDISSNGKSWKVHAMKHIFEAMDLSSNARHQYGICVWKLNYLDEAEQALLQAADISDIMDLEGCEGIGNLDLANSFCNAYWFAMTLEELAVQSLEVTPGSKKCRGDNILRIACAAIQCASAISDSFTVFKEKHSIENNKAFQAISASAKLKEEEILIRELWRMKQMPTHQDHEKNALLISLKELQNLTRGELLNDISKSISSSGQKRSFIVEENSMAYVKRYKEANSCNTIMLSNPFHSKNMNSNFEKSRISKMTAHSNGNSVTQYLPWGDEVLKPHELNKFPACCPPLPSDMPLDIQIAIKKKMGNILQ